MTEVQKGEHILYQTEEETTKDGRTVSDHNSKH